MINSTEGLEPGALYTSNGKDVWEVESFFEMPSVTLKNLRTGERMTGGVGCLNFTPFVPLVPEGPSKEELERRRKADQAAMDSLTKRDWDADVMVPQ